MSEELGNGKAGTFLPMMSKGVENRKTKQQAQGTGGARVGPGVTGWVCCWLSSDTGSQAPCLTAKRPEQSSEAWGPQPERV